MFNPQLCNTSTWSKVLVNNLSEIDKNVYINRKRVVDMYMNEIENKTGIKSNDVRRYVKHCMSIDDTGAMYGYTALIPYKRIKKYSRQNNSMHFIGSFSQLLENYPEVKEFIRNQYFSINKSKINEHNIKINTGG